MAATKNYCKFFWQTMTKMSLQKREKNQSPMQPLPSKVRYSMYLLTNCLKPKANQVYIYTRGRNAENPTYEDLVASDVSYFFLIDHQNICLRMMCWSTKNKQTKTSFFHKVHLFLWVYWFSLTSAHWFGIGLFQAENNVDKEKHL